MPIVLALLVGVDAEATEVDDRVREVGLVRLFEMVPRPWLHDLLGEPHHVVRLDYRCVRDTDELAVDPHSRRGTYFQVEIGTFRR